MVMSAVNQHHRDARPLTNRIANFVGQNEIRTNQIERQDCDSLATVILFLLGIGFFAKRMFTEPV